MDNQKIGKLIAVRRREKELTQKQLAEKIGVTNKAVSKWETGEGYPDITILPKLAEILSLSVDELLLGEIRNRESNIEGKITNEKLKGLNKNKFIKLTSIAIYLIATSIYFIGHYGGWLTNPSVIFSVYLIATAIIILINVAYSHK